MQQTGSETETKRFNLKVNERRQPNDNNRTTITHSTVQTSFSVLCRFVSCVGCCCACLCVLFRTCLCVLFCTCSCALFRTCLCVLFGTCSCVSCCTFLSVVSFLRANNFAVARTESCSFAFRFSAPVRSLS